MPASLCSTKANSRFPLASPTGPHKFKKIWRTHLASFQHDFQAIERRIVRVSPAQRRARLRRCHERQRMKAQLLRSLARRVATRNHNTPHAALDNKFPQEHSHLDRKLIALRGDASIRFAERAVKNRTASRGQRLLRLIEMCIAGS